MKGQGRIMNFVLLAFMTFCGIVAPVSAAAQDKAPGGNDDVFKDLKYRLIGPAAGGRVTRAAGVPGNPLVYYAASASGGLWKSTDGGYRWKPIFDGQAVASIGSLAIAPSDPNVIYAGSGEANIRGNVAAGNGIYKSVDAGKTWSHVWKQRGQIGTIIVHPAHPDIALAAVLGHAFGPNPERGIYRTTDGGKNWERVLFKDADTGASDVCFDPANPNILFAGLWQARRYPWTLTSGGPGSGLYTSRDGGTTWKQVTGNGLPSGNLGKIGVVVAPSDPRRVYALIEAEDGGLFRSDDGGEKWARVHEGRGIRQRAWYYSTLTVDPGNADVIWAPQVPMLRSIDGGSTFKNVKGFRHGDHHDLWIDPENPKRMIDSNDGGVEISLDGGESWYAPPLPISQFYHVAVDGRKPYFVSGAMQDLGTAAGPSNSLRSSGISLSDWYVVGGGEAGHTAHDPFDSNVVYAGEYAGYISRYDFRTGQARNISIYPDNPSGHGAEDQKYRFQWTAPILVSSHDPGTVYHGGNLLFKTTDGGSTWLPISPDLTRNDRSKQQWSGGPITGDNTGAEHYCTIFAIAESPLAKDLLWIGSDDGLVHLTRDGGKTWRNVTAAIPGTPEWGTISIIEASRFDPGTAYVVVDAHRLDDYRPYLYRTTDYGATWNSLSGNLPQDVYLHAVREDPVQKGLLYLGTESGVSFSRDGGGTWQSLQLNLPTVAVHDLRVQGNDLVLATHGRSLWILDDLTPVREFNPRLAAAGLHLFTPNPATRYRYHGRWGDAGTYENPPRGALIYYCLAQKPKEDLKLEILTSQGRLVRTLSSKAEQVEKSEFDYSEDEQPRPALSAEAGLHRVVWDLAYEGAVLIKKAILDAGNPRQGPMAVPGAYTIRLIADGKVVTAPLSIEPDPRVSIPAADLEAQLQLALSLRDDISQLARNVNQIRLLREQARSLQALIVGNAKYNGLAVAARDALQQLDDLEARLHNPKAQIVYDILAQKGGAKLYSKMSQLLDYLKDSDGKPTQGMREMYAEYQRELQSLGKQFQDLLSGPVRKLNDHARRVELPCLILPVP